MTKDIIDRIVSDPNLDPAFRAGVHVDQYVHVVKGFAEPFDVKLVVDHQSFVIGRGWETRVEADCIADALKTALARMIMQINERR